MHEQDVSEREQGVDGIEGWASTPSVQLEEGIVHSQELVEHTEIPHGGVSFDSAQVFEIGGLAGVVDAFVQLSDAAVEFGLVAVVADGPEEDLTTVKDFSGDEIAGDGERCGGGFADAVLFPAQEDVSRDSPGGGGEKFSVWGEK